MGSVGKPTIHQVAERAGVSVGSVSRALNQYPHVSEALRQRVEDAARELGYQPGFLAHSLRRGTTNTVGFLVGTLANPVVATIFEGAAELLNASGYAMTLMSSRNNSLLDNAHLHLLASRQVSGLVISSASDGDDQISSVITQLGIPTVMLDRQPAEGKHVRAVQSDHIGGIRTAVAHLVAQGHRDIAFIGGPENFHPTRERFTGYQLALKEANIPAKRDLIHFIPFTESDAYAETLLLFSRRSTPTAIIAAGNIILVGILWALQELNIAVGSHIALVSCDEIPLTRLHKPPITVVARDLQLIGKTAARLLVDGMDQPGDRVVKLPTHLIVRESTTGVRT